MLTPIDVSPGRRTLDLHGTRQLTPDTFDEGTLPTAKGPKQPYTGTVGMNRVAYELEGRH